MKSLNKWRSIQIHKDLFVGTVSFDGIKIIYLTLQNAFLFWSQNIYKKVGWSEWFNIVWDTLQRISVMSVSLWCVCVSACVGVCVHVCVVCWCLIFISVALRPHSAVSSCQCLCVSHSSHSRPLNCLIEEVQQSDSSFSSTPFCVLCDKKQTNQENVTFMVNRNKEAMLRLRQIEHVNRVPNEVKYTL